MHETAKTVGPPNGGTIPAARADERRSALDSMITIVAPRYWVALIAVGALLLGVAAWSVFGRIETTVPGEGVLLTGGAVQEVHAGESGVLQSYSVQVGVPVVQGAVVANVKLANGGMATITSPVAGMVSALQAGPGQAVQSGQSVLTVADPNAPLQVAGTVEAQAANQVQVGDAVRVIPLGTNSTGLETVPATVVSVSALPVSTAELTAQLGSQALATQLVAGGGSSVKSVTLSFVAVTPTASGFLVSNSHGGQTAVRFGMQTTFQIVTASEAPIDKVLK